MLAQSVALRPLKCIECGAAVPLGDAKTARCPFCRKETPVPDEYRAAQRAARSFADDRKLAEQLYGRVGKPPSRISRALQYGALDAASFAARIGYFILLLVIGTPLSIPFLMLVAWLLGYPVAAAFRAVSSIAGHPHPGPIDPIPVIMAASFLAAFGLGIPLVLFSKERELAEVRASIHASLAAKIPERPGGPSCCRTCGAALDVPRGALGVPCVYCRSDNLVALPEAWVVQVRAREFQHFLQIDSALEAFRLASERAKERMWKIGFWFVIVFPLVFFLALLLEGHFDY